MSVYPEKGTPKQPGKYKQSSKSNSTDVLVMENEEPIYNVKSIFADIYPDLPHNLNDLFKKSLKLFNEQIDEGMIQDVKELDLDKNKDVIGKILNEVINVLKTKYHIPAADLESLNLQNILTKFEEAKKMDLSLGHLKAKMNAEIEAIELREKKRNLNGVSKEELLKIEEDYKKDRTEENKERLETAKGSNLRLKEFLDERFNSGYKNVGGTPDILKVLGGEISKKNVIAAILIIGGVAACVITSGVACAIGIVVGLFGLILFGYGMGPLIRRGGKKRRSSKSKKRTHKKKRRNKSKKRN
jgi:hypothetical protein